MGKRAGLTTTLLLLMGAVSHASASSSDRSKWLDQRSATGGARWVKKEIVAQDRMGAQGSTCWPRDRLRLQATSGSVRMGRPGRTSRTS